MDSIKDFKDINIFEKNMDRRNFIERYKKEKEEH